MCRTPACEDMAGRRLELAVLCGGALLRGALGLTDADCKSIKVPQDPDSGLPDFTVRHNPEEETCTAECDMKPAGSSKVVVPCVVFVDSATSIMTKAGLWSDETCQSTSVEAPDKAPGTTDVELVVSSCPDWFLYAGWDRSMNRTMGNLRQELTLKSSPALEAFKKALPALVESAVGAALEPVTEADCKSIKVPVDQDSGLPIFSVRYSDEEKHCTVECAMEPPGSNKTVLACAAFADWATSSMTTAGLWSDKTCRQTSILAPDAAPGTIDFELLVASCPSWFLFTGWDRGVKRTLGNMRQEFTLKTPIAIEAFKKTLPEQPGYFNGGLHV